MSPFQRYPRLSFLSLALLPASLWACASSSSAFDANGDRVADDLGRTVDTTGTGYADQIDIDGDGIKDGPGVDTNGDGFVDALGLDTDCDGYFDAITTRPDKAPEFKTSRIPDWIPPGCEPTGTGGTPPTGSGGGGNPPSGGLGTMPTYQGSGITTDRYDEGAIYRNRVPYMFIANGWGAGWQSHRISWNGTSFTVDSLNGTQGTDYSPAGYPTMFCGSYSIPAKLSPGNCGLPAAISSLRSVRTGWAWDAAGQTGQYNAAWDIWLSNDGVNLSSYLMVWLRDPPGQQPAGAATAANVSVANVPGTWNVWVGTVNGRPIVNYVKPEGQDIYELEFDVLDFHRDAVTRGYTLPGSHMLSVAIGFEIWNGPVSGIASKDFYVHVE